MKPCLVNALLRRYERRRPGVPASSNLPLAERAEIATKEAVEEVIE
jgi:hypothetical protein